MNAFGRIHSPKINVDILTKKKLKKWIASPNFFGLANTFDVRMLRFLLTGPMSVFRHCSSQLRKKPGSRFAYFTRIRIPTTELCDKDKDDLPACPWRGTSPPGWRHLAEYSSPKPLYCASFDWLKTFVKLVFSLTYPASSQTSTG